MAYFGVQHFGHVAAADVALSDLAASFASDGGPAHWDRSRYTDEAGYANVICAAYWDESARNKRPSGNGFRCGAGGSARDA